ncbi:hypothetical protein [Paraburkholderia caffeinilytica]|uniref:hypothetical protein n=1 Tax=Paraburkholderia caffeinilytica TaxID=1761016 RepID=UPI003D9FFA3B
MSKNAAAGAHVEPAAATLSITAACLPIVVTGFSIAPGRAIAEAAYPQTTSQRNDLFDRARRGQQRRFATRLTDDLNADR